MEEALIRLCGDFGVRAGRICGLTGVWCGPADGSPLDESRASRRPAGERKIGAIGIHVSRGVTSHGFAFNVTTDLRDFELDQSLRHHRPAVTSLGTRSRRARQLPDLEAIAHRAARQFGHVFGQQVLAVESLSVLRAQADCRRARRPAPPFPQDTPLQIPAEVERLRSEDRPAQPECICANPSSPSGARDL